MDMVPISCARKKKETRRTWAQVFEIECRIVDRECLYFKLPKTKKLVAPFDRGKSLDLLFFKKSDIMN